MKIKVNARAGTFESSDILILVEPWEGRKIELDSTVLLEYKDSILAQIESVLDDLGVTDVHLIAKDKGALNLTIAARVETAVTRAGGLQEGTFYESR